MTDYQQPAAAAPPKEPTGFKGIFNDPSTLAATGIILSVLCATTAGLINFLTDVGDGGMRARLHLLTDTVDIGDVAVLGIAIALLVLTPDPPGGVPRPLLMQTLALLSTVVGIFGLIRSLVILTDDGFDAAPRLANFITTMGVAIAAATIAFYAARESLIVEREEAAANAAS